MRARELPHKIVITQESVISRIWRITGHGLGQVCANPRPSNEVKRFSEAVRAADAAANTASRVLWGFRPFDGGLQVSGVRQQA